MKRILSFVIAMIMVLSLFPAMIFTSSAEDVVDYQHVTVRTEGVTPYPQQMTAGTVLDVVGGTNPIDTGAANNVRPTDKGVGGSAHGSYNSAWSNGVGTVAMRSANTWLYGYVIKVEGLTSAAQANVTAQGWGHNGPVGAGTTGGGWNMEYKDAKYNIPGDGVYAILMNGQVFGGKMNADRVAVAFVQKMQISLDKDATVTFLGEIEAATEDITAESFANTLPINYMVNGTLETVEYPITEGLTKGQYVTAQDAVAIPALDKKLDSVVNDTAKSTHIGWASTENADEADVACAITEKGILDAIYPVYFTVPNVDAPAKQDGYNAVEHEPVVLNTNPTTQQAVWGGSVALGTGTGVSGVTLVYKVDGVETPIIGNDFNFKYNGSTWFSGSWFFGADGKYAWGGAPSPALVTYDKSGYYFTYVQGRLLNMTGGTGLTSVDGIELFKNATSETENHPRSVNTNSNATFELKAVVENNLAPTVNFYNGETLVATKTYQYTDGYTSLDWWGDGNKTSKQGKILTADEIFELTGETAPTKEFDGTYNYRLVWVDENKQPVDGIYTSMNVYASFVPVAASQVTVTFVDAADKIINSSYVEKGSTVEFTGTVPGKNTTETTAYVFSGWSTEKGGEAVDLSTCVIEADTTFYPVFAETILPVVTIFDNPVSTTFGTKKNLLPDGFNATVSGLTGYTMILKVDGIPYGQTAKWGGIRPIVHAVDGSDKDPIWCGNWIADSYATNSYTFNENGYYLYYFPFKSVVNELASEKTVAGVSRLNSFTVFDKSGALGNNGAGSTTTDENITVTLIGMVEGNVVPFDVTAKKGDTVLATEKTTASINMLNSINNAGWAKLDTGFDLFGDQLGVEGSQYIESWTNDEGEANEYILNEKVVRPVYGDSILLTVTPAGNTAYGVKDYAVDITINAENVDSAEITLIYDKNVFTNPHLADGTPLVECPQGALLALNYTNKETVLFDIPENAVGGGYTFNADAVCSVDGVDSPAKTTGAVGVTVSGQQPGGYFTEGENRVQIYKTNENNAAVDADGNEVAEQKVWTGNVNFGSAKDSVTFVFKVDGVKTDINATRIHFNTNNGGQWKTANWSQWRENWGRDADKTNGFCSALTFKASDGATYYYLTLGSRYINNDGSAKYNSMEGFTLFKKDPSSKTTKLSWTNGDYTETQAAENANEDAGFEMLAVVGGNLAPQVEFYNDSAANGGALVGAYTYEYPKATAYADGTGANTKMKKYGNLVTVADVFAASGYQTPVKASTDEAAYEFIGWVDENGNDITNAPVYKAQRIYANFKAVEVTKSTVTFMNDDAEFGKCEGVLLNAFATAPEGTPARAGTATGEYTFKGWSLEKDGEVIDLATYPITQDVTLYASYEYNDVVFNVTYVSGKDEEGNDIVFYTEKVVRSKDASYENTPKYATDAYTENEDGTVADAYYHNFVRWTDAEGNAAVLTNVQDNITVYAYVVDTPVENWYKVTWQEDNGTVLDSKMVAEGDGVSTAVKGVMDGKADETKWYKQTGWSVPTTAITADTVVNPVYDTSVAVDVSSLYTEYSATGLVNNKLVVFGGDLGSYTFVNPKEWNPISVLVKIEGASETNPVTVGGLRTTGFGGIDSMNSGNYSETKPLINAATQDGYYYANLGGAILTWAANAKSIGSLAISDPDAKRGGKSSDASGEAKMTVTFIEGFFTPTVRFYDENGAWLATNKVTTNASNWSYDTASAPELASLYNGAALGDDFLYWADKDGNEVKQVYDNMDVHAVCKPHTHNYVIKGAGVIECVECGEVVENAPTLTAGDAEISALKAGETVEVPVVITNNPGLIGITFNVETSENVELTSVALNGTVFEGADIEVGTSVVINKGTSTENITADGTVAVLTLTATADIAEGDTVDVKVVVEDTADTSLDKPVVYSGLTSSYVATAPAYIIGDVDGSGEIDAIDVTTLSRYVAKWSGIVLNEAAADVDGSGEIDAIDVTTLSRYVAKWSGIILGKQ